jgi:hypothetical protein
MNERIKELILKAGWKNAYTNPKEGFEVVFVDEDHNLDCIEKFAELIVRECVQQINEAIPETDCSSSGAYRTAKIAATARIAKHFGVE